jgi:hypothetical protein
MGAKSLEDDDETILRTLRENCSAKGRGRVEEKKWVVTLSNKGMFHRDIFHILIIFGIRGKASLREVVPKVKATYKEMR